MRPEAWAMNTAWIEPVETERLRVVFTHAQPAATAVSEILVWENDT
jgi:hypothetical protein